MGIFIILVVLCLIHPRLAYLLHASRNDFNVMSFGAVGDGKTDDSQAFLKAWAVVCRAEGHSSSLIIPSGRTFVIGTPVSFQGKCNAEKIYFQNMGTILAPESPYQWTEPAPARWLEFYSIDGLHITGWGTINGRGSNWWDKSCVVHPGPGCLLPPMSLNIQSCNNLVLKEMNFLDSASFHVHINGCENVHVSNLRIRAPGDSPNTDGIHLATSIRVRMENLIIGTGDDCISLGDPLYDVSISHIYCGPGHGISIGSLGRNGDEVKVENIVVKHVVFRNTTNGARIKTWQGGRGYARNITFDDMYFFEAWNPLIIDQYYCTDYQCPNKTEAVKISDVSFMRVRGSSSSEMAVNLKCSENVPCTEIKMRNVKLVSDVKGTDLQSYCLNAHGNAMGVIDPAVPCLS